MISNQPISGLLGEVFTPRYPRRYVGRHRRLGGSLRRLARSTRLGRA